MNPMEFMKGIKNPQQFVINMLGQNQTLNKILLFFCLTIKLSN